MQFKDHILNLPAYKPTRLLAGHQGEVVKLSSNENALGPSPRAIAALQAAMANVHRYPDSGAATLRRALAERADLTPESVMCSNGSDEMIFLLCTAFLSPGDEAVMAEGTFISYFLRTLEMGGKPVRIPLRDYTHNLPALIDTITPRTRLLFVCNPNNPTGTTNSAAEIAALIANVPDDTLIVMDEAYIEFVTRADYPDLLPELRNGRRNLILLRTFAKIYGLAGLRLGYAYGHPDVISYLDRARPTFNVNALAQIAGLAALDDQDHVARSRDYANASRAMFVSELNKLGLHYIPGETNFVAINVGDDITVAEGIRERGFTVTPLAGWGLPGLIRVSFGTMEQNHQFIAALAETLKA